jgi:hypothetical protein
MKLKIKNGKNLFFLIFLFNLLMSGCAYNSMFGTSKNQKSKAQCAIEIEDRYGNICDQYRGQYECAIGVGDSYDDAIKEAKRKLSENILTVVESSLSKNVKKEFMGNEKITEIVKSKKEWSSINLTYLELEGAQIEKKDKEGDCYYAVVIWEKEKADKAAEKFRKKADAIMYVNLIEKIDDISLKLKLLVSLENIVAHKNLQNETVVVNGEVTTFKAYLNSMFNFLFENITIAFTGNKFYLLTKKSFLPIKDIKVTIQDSEGKKETFVSSMDGEVYIPRNFTLPVNVYVTLTQKDFHIGTVVKKDVSRIYISTSPSKIGYELYKNGKVISTGTTPNMIEVYPDKYDKYKVVLLESKRYRKIEQVLPLRKGFDAYFFRQMEKVRYGKVDLSVNGSAILKISSADGRVIDEDRDQFQGKVPVGTYLVTVKRRDDSREYQIVKDRFMLYENKSIKREYFEPRDRIFTRSGFGFFLGFTSQTPSTLTIDGEEDNKGLLDKNDFEESIMYLGLRKYFTHFFVGGGAGFALEDTSSSSSSSSSSSNGYYLDATTGVYMPVEWLGGTLELGLGYEYMNASTERKVYYDDYYYYEYKNIDLSYSAPFASIKITAASVLGLELRVYEDQTQLVFSIGATKLHSKYKLPREVTARRGRDYE